MKKFTGCVIKDNTITLTKAFAKNAYTPGTEEFRYLTELHKAFPDFPIVQRIAKKNENKEKFTDLSVDRMEKFIKWFKGEKELAEFLNAKDFYKGTTGYYGKMKKWFLDKYKDEYLNADFSQANKPNEEKKPAEAPATEENADLRIAG